MQLMKLFSLVQPTLNLQGTLVATWVEFPRNCLHDARLFIFSFSPTSHYAIPRSSRWIVQRVTLVTA